MTKPGLLLLLALVVLCPAVTPAQSPNFSGTWKIASADPPAPAGRGRGAAGGGISGPYAETILAQAPEVMVLTQNATTITVQMGAAKIVFTLDDKTTWTKPWTARQEFNRQSDQANRIYQEPRCHEGNAGMIGMLAGPRAMETAFAEGRGPDPATTGGAGGGLGGEENQDILQ